MKLERFDKNRNYKKALIITLVAIVLLGGGILVYRTFALYETKKEYNVLEGTVGRFQTGGNDITIAVVVDDKQQSTFPKKYQGYENTKVECTNNATATWNKDKWSIAINNIESSSTICTVYFKKLPSLTNFEEIASLAGEEGECSASGIAKVSHEDATIVDAGYSTFTKPLNYSEVQTNLKQTEYRYCGEDPNNYVTFNNEVAGWRIIGLVNTPEGQRIKLIRANSIGNISWDNKPSGEGSSLNEYGSNDWTDSVLKEILNSGTYYNQSSGTCPTGRNDESAPCDFSENSKTPGLTDDAKEMIDTITWNLGGHNTLEILTKQIYNYERGTEVYKDTKVTRPTLWQGQIGLIYPSDYSYATSGDDNKALCQNTVLSSWNNYSQCYENSWLYDSNNIVWTLTQHTGSNNDVIRINKSGHVDCSFGASQSFAIYPTLYLKSDINIVSGNGLKSDPYVISKQ